MADLTEEDAKRFVAEEMAWAKEQRSSMPFSAQNDFHPRITVFGPNGLVAKPPMRWGDRDEMRGFMNSMAVAARVMSAQAVMLASDSTGMDTAKVAAFLGLTVPRFEDPESMKAFSREYSRVFNAPLLNRDMRNLPEEFWTNQLLVVIKGPNIPTLGATALYLGDEEGRVVYTEKVGPVGVHSFNMLADWWTIPDEHPAIKRAMRVVDDFMAGRR